MQSRIRPLIPLEQRWQTEGQARLAVSSILKRAKNNDDGIKLHLGCGPNVMPGWRNLDMLAAPGVEFCDLRGKLPFDSQTADVIFSEQFFEHLDYHQGLFFLQECMRVLKPGGAIRVTTPDLKTIVKDYEAGALQRWVLEGFQPPSACHMLNGFAKNWGHQFLYDEEELGNSLGLVGFTNIRRQKWRESDVSALRAVEFRTDCRDLILQASRRKQS